MEDRADERVPAVWRATVLDGADPEDAGRVRIQLARELGAKEAWARLAVWFRPAPGDEVVIAFEAGEVRSPVVLGALWSSSDSPPGCAKDG